jgi:hypothetical protein
MEKRVEMTVSFTSDTYESSVESAEILSQWIERAINSWGDTYQPHVDYTINGKSPEEARQYL